MLLNTGPGSVCVSGPLSNPRMGRARKTKVPGWHPSAPHQAALLTLNSLPNVYLPSPLCLLSHFFLPRIPSFPSLLEEPVSIFQMFPFFMKFSLVPFRESDRSLLQISLLLAGLLRTSLIAFCIAFCFLLSAFPALHPDRQ